MHAEPDPAKHVLAHVFKVTADPFVGKLGIFRIHQGTVAQGSQLYVGHGRKPFKVGQLFMLQGKEHVEVPRAFPGDICAVAKVDELHFDAVLHDAAEDEHIHLKPLDFPVPVHGLAISPKRHGDEQRMWEILNKLVAEDPCLKVEHLATTNETVLYGLGELHLRMLLERLREVYKFEVDTRPPRIAYRESVTAQGGRPSPPQEAERRRRPVRRGLPAHRAAAARRRLRVRRCGQGWHHPRPVHAGGGKGRARGAGQRRDRRLPGGRRQGHRLRRQAPQRGQQGDRLRHGRPQGLRRGHPRGAADRARADRAHRDQRARHGDGRHHRRPVVQARPGQRHAQRRRRDDGGARPGADVRAVGLPVAPQCHDQRPGPLHDRAVALRGACRPPCSSSWSQRTRCTTRSEPHLPGRRGARAAGLADPAGAARAGRWAAAAPRSAPR